MVFNFLLLTKKGRSNTKTEGNVYFLKHRFKNYNPLLYFLWNKSLHNKAEKSVDISPAHISVFVYLCKSHGNSEHQMDLGRELLIF